MISIFDLEKQVKSDDIKNVYVFCGMDENLIKDSIKLIVDKVIDPSFKELNYIRIDGDNTDFQTVENACETLPFMSDKKVVVMYRSSFLNDKTCKAKKEKGKLYNSILKYCSNIPQHCILIIYNLFNSDRDKPGKNHKKMDNIACVVKVDKLKGEVLRKKVKECFNDKGKKIGRTELNYFCNEVDNNMEIIQNEIEKLCSYTDGREIKKEDIYDMLPQKSENDIFNLVDFLSQKKIKNALDILNELIFKGEKPSYILYMIQRQFKLIFHIKLGMIKGKSADKISSELFLNRYICEKMMNQSKKFTLENLEKILELCLDTEKRIKSSSVDHKMEMEMLIINTIRN